MARESVYRSTNRYASPAAMFFEGFELTRARVPDGELRLRVGGSGPPLLLLHGNPQTHAMWHAIAPELARRFTVICPDLRGYGGSFKPPATPDHRPYAKRTMAMDLIALMDSLDHERFSVVSHDRGARVAHRLAIDFPDRVQRLAVLDVVPTIEQYEQTDMDFAMGYYHFFFFAQPHPVPETLLWLKPEILLGFTGHERECSFTPPSFFHPEAFADYLAAIRAPETIVSMCEDYRAAATIDLEHDRQSRDAGARVRCPMLVLWGAKWHLERWYDPLKLWRRYCNGEVMGGPIDCGHYIAEERPDELASWLDRFLPG